VSAYVTPGETLDFLNLDENEGIPESTLQTLIAAGKEMIDGFCGREFTDAVPSLVEAVNMELVRALLADSTKQSEGTEGYNYTNNADAFSQILARLSYLKIDGAVMGKTDKQVNVRVI
jgi:hypothetical protein